MSQLWKGTKRYALIYSLFFKNSLIALMEYRINFIFGVMVELGFIVIKLSYVYVVFRVGENINGLTPYNVMLFVGTFIIMSGIYSALLFFNFVNLPELIRTGDLDTYITKPISLQFITTMKSIDISFAVPNIIGGIIVVVIGWNQSGIPVNLSNLAGYIGYLILGVILTYSLFLLPQLLAFWTVKTNGINDISNALFDFNQMPMTIYNKLVQRAGTFLIPVFLLTNYSPLFLLNGLSKLQMVWGIAAPFIFLILVRLLWKYALKQYTSASS
ncbi:ABC transporter permease [Paenibacillus sinopodophylli]|uniref:ABC transporter permease n=1 Tax=Paenibacillus sinopodophylli TaxID=1837342 RepID=UPI00110D19E6|nr:ABC-2 family transporter protein [Paenibacillus sinopodophylli]